MKDLYEYIKVQSIKEGIDILTVYKFINIIQKYFKGDYKMKFKNCSKCGRMIPGDYVTCIICSK